MPDTSKNLFIAHSYNLSRPRRTAHRFTVEPTSDHAHPLRHADGPVVNNITPTSTVIVSNSTDAGAAIAVLFGSDESDRAYSLIHVSPQAAQPYYKILPMWLSPRLTYAPFIEDRPHTLRVLFCRDSDGSTSDANVQF